MIYNQNLNFWLLLLKKLIHNYLAKKKLPGCKGSQLNNICKIRFDSKLCSFQKKKSWNTTTWNVLRDLGFPNYDAIKQNRNP